MLLKFTLIRGPAGVLCLGTLCCQSRWQRPSMISTSPPAGMNVVLGPPVLAESGIGVWAHHVPRGDGPRRQHRLRAELRHAVLNPADAADVPRTPSDWSTVCATAARIYFAMLVKRE